ncbi:MAG: outer membrane protein assembly factor BamC [Motiliproteus sp.]|nr:outer membrane protein assembly factor BamC [Motiliproteus sp.]MCW9054169.1 outer membrane protein assembly factor BamC [Motiliproteus sp.]
MRSFNAVAVVLIASVLGGCGWMTDNAIYGDDGLIRDRAQDYEKAQTIPRIKVPDHLDDESIVDLLVIPEVGTVATVSEQEFEVPRPDLFYADAGNEVVDLAREGLEKFIVVDEPANKVWDKVIEFWAYNDINVEVTDPSQGLMETAWISDESDEPGFFTNLVRRSTFQKVGGAQKDKLRVRIGRTDDNGRTAIRMKHLRTTDVEPVADWSRNAQDVSYKSEMMYAMLHYLSKATTASTVSAMKKREKLGAAKALLGRDSNGNPILKLNTDVDRAWSWIDQAMVNADMDVGSFNRDIGKFYITYTTTTPFDQNEEGGFWNFINWLHSEDREEFKISTDFLAEAVGLQEDEGSKIRYSQKVQEDYDPDDLSQKQGYKIWLGGKVIYVFGSGGAAGVENEETGELEVTGRFQVKLSRRRTGIFVSVLDEEARYVSSIIAEEILWNIKDHLPKG